MTARVPLTPADEDVDVADRLLRSLRRLVRWSRRAAVTPLGPGTLSALATTVDAGPVRLGELAAKEGVTPATLSRIVAVLEGEELVERAADPADRRSAFVFATDRGRELVDRVRRDRATALLDRVARLEPHHRAALLGAVDALEALVDDADPRPVAPGAGPRVDDA